MFRLLRADEIDCRVSQINENGLSLLLYKDARCDMNILDETVGPFRWQRHHSRDNANCIVSIFDVDKAEWISKEDVGTESNTEAQKGLASDSFKRACFNWGIGRELYSAPFIWVNASDCGIKEKNGRYVCNDRFEVEAIEYDESQDISRLTIINRKTGQRVFSWKKGVKQVERPVERPAPVEKPADKYDFVPDCAICHKPIDARVHDYSVRRFGRPLCRDCQKKA